jgi:hypothetical protein
VIIDKGDDIAADLAAVQGAIALGLEPVEQRLGSVVALQHVAKRRVVAIAVDALGEPEVEHGVEAEEDGVPIVLLRGVLADVAVVDVVRRCRNFAEEEERALAEAVGVLADVRAEARAGQVAHVLHGVHAEAIDVRFANPVAMRGNQRRWRSP